MVFLTGHLFECSIDSTVHPYPASDLPKVLWSHYFLYSPIKVHHSESLLSQSRFVNDVWFQEKTRYGRVDCCNIYICTELLWPMSLLLQWAWGLSLSLTCNYVKYEAKTTILCIWCRAIRKSNCYHFNGHGADCQFGNSFYMIMFGVIQIFCSLIPDFNNMSWLSTVAAIMSGFYSTIGLGLGIARVIGEFHTPPLCACMPTDMFHLVWAAWMHPCVYVCVPA